MNELSENQKAEGKSRHTGSQTETRGEQPFHYLFVIACASTAKAATPSHRTGRPPLKRSTRSPTSSTSRINDPAILLHDDVSMPRWWSTRIETEGRQVLVHADGSDNRSGETVT